MKKVIRQIAQDTAATWFVAGVVSGLLLVGAAAAAFWK